MSRTHFTTDTFFSVFFSACVIGYEEKTANGKIQKEQEQNRSFNLTVREEQRNKTGTKWHL